MFRSHGSVFSEHAGWTHPYCTGVAVDIRYRALVTPPGAVFRLRWASLRDQFPENLPTSLTEKRAIIRGLRPP